MKLSKKVVAAVCVAGLILGSAGVANADNLQDDVVASGNGTFAAGQTTTVNYSVHENGSDGCNVDSTHTAMMLVNAPSGLTATPSSLTFSSCDTSQPVVFSSSTPGDYDLAPSISGGKSGNNGYNVHPAKATLVVTAATSSADTTDPSITSFSINDADAWTNTTGVTVDIAASDNVGLAGFTLSNSPITSTSPAVTPFASTDIAHTLSTGDGTKTVYVRVFDAAGNYADSSATIGLDTVEPVISSSTGTYTPGTWTNQNVVVSFTCADPAPSSGLATNTVAGATVSTDGGAHEVTNTGDCTDNAGNEADPVSVVDIKVDKTKPTSTVSGVVAGRVYDAAPTVTCEGSDGLSGIASHGSPSGNTATPGVKTVTCNGAVDNAGNVQDVDGAAVSYTLAPLGGFNSNFDNSGVLKVKPNQAIPLKWAITDGSTNYAMLSTASISSVSSTRCIAGGADGTEEPATEFAAGASGLQLLPDNSYQMNWKATSTTGCRALTVTMNLTSGGSMSRTILVNIAK